MSWRVLEGDATERLAELDAGSVQTCITSPPYWGLRDYGSEPSVWGGDPDHEHDFGEWQESHDEREATQHGKTRTTDRFYGDESRRFDGNHQKHSAGSYCRCGAFFGQLGLEPTPEQYVANLVAVFREVRRVLRDDGTVWLNLGDSYCSTAPGTTNAPMPKGSRANAAEWANYRPDTPEGMKPKDLVGIPWMVAFALRADGWWLRSDIVWAKPNPMPESVTDRPTRSHEYIFLLTKSARYFYDADAIREANQLADTGWANTRSEITAKTSGNGETSQGFAGTNRVGSIEAGRNKRSVWTVATQPFPGAHFATFPPKLIEPCVLAGSPPKCCGECGAPWERIVERGESSWERRKADGDPIRYGLDGNAAPLNRSLTDQADRHAGGFGVPAETQTLGWRSTCTHDDDTGRSLILDAFCGAGTTGVVALRHDRSFVGIELNADYAEMARNRIRDDAPLFNVSAEHEPRQPS